MPQTREVASAAFDHIELLAWGLLKGLGIVTLVLRVVRVGALELGSCWRELKRSLRRRG